MVTHVHGESPSMTESSLFHSSQIRGGTAIHFRHHEALRGDLAAGKECKHGFWCVERSSDVMET